MQEIFNRLSKSYGSKNERDLLISSLERLCFSIDPFKPLHEDQIDSLKKLGINHESSPYELTNTLIFLLEEFLQERLAKAPKDLGEGKSIHQN